MNVANLLLQGSLYAETLHWMPGFSAMNQTLITIFGLASFWNCYRASQYRKPTAGADHGPETYKDPRVALCLTAVNEPGEIVERSLTAIHAVDYGPKDIFLLDDSEQGSASSAVYKRLVNNLAEKGIRVIHLRRKDDPSAYKGGYKAGNMNYFLTGRYGKSYKYFAGFDADFRPAATFLRATIPIMESPKNGRIAILQTAQQFEHHPENPVSSAVYAGDATMGDIHGKGKDANKTLFWYGSGALLRTDALFQAAAERGMPETPVRMETLSEDYDTSIGLTRESNGGWQVRYLDDYLSKGIQPETLLRYFKRQRRWILGSTQVVNKRLIPLIPQLLRSGEYEQVATILVDTLYRISPLQSFLFASSAAGFAMLPKTGNIHQVLLASGLATLMLISNWSVYFYRGIKRGCSFSEILRNLDLYGIAAPVYLEAFVRSLSSKKLPFETTNVAKTGHEPIPLKWLLPNLAILGSSIGALSYILGDAVWDSINMATVSFPLLIFKSLWMLNNIRSSSRIAEFNDGWGNTLSDLLEGTKQATNSMLSALQAKAEFLGNQLSPINSRAKFTFENQWL